MKRILMTALAMLLAVSCSKTKKYPIPLFDGSGGEVTSDGSSTSVASQGLLSISVEPANRSIPVGIPQDYTAMGIYSDGYTRDITKDVTWSSGDTAVATIVANTGEVTGVSTGSIQITATLSDISGTGNLTVTTATLVSIEVVRPNPSASVASGTAIPVQFTAIGTMSDGTTVDLTKVADWSSSDTGQATVDNSTSKGSVTGVAAGVPTITASYSSISGTRDITVTAATLTSISIDSDTTITINGNKTYRAIATFSDGSTQDITDSVTWSTGDTNIATIETGSSTNNTGLATGKSAGSTSITATYNGISASSTLTVVDSSTVSSLSISPSGTTTIGKNTKQNYTATVTYSDGTTKNVTSSAAWTSSAISIAGMSNLSGSEGEASGVSVGSTTITASFGGKTATATLAVAERTLTSIAVSNVTVSAGSGKQLTATATYSDGSTQDVTSAVTWNQVVDTSIAEVSGGSSDYGTVYGKSAGDSTVTATLSGVTSNAATVSVKSLTSIAVSSTSVAKGSTAQLTATGTYSDGSTEDITNQVTWTPNTGSGDTTYFVVGNVDGEKGLVTGKSAGSAVATATLYGAGNAGANVSGSGTITVTDSSSTTGGTETKSVSVSSTVSLDVGSTTTTETKPTGDFDGALLIIGDENTKAFVANITGGTLHACADVTCLMDKILQAVSEDDFD
ncbi:MAG: Ig-like domain-containing protein, partial [Spirochaetota bacterium]